MKPNTAYFFVIFIFLNVGWLISGLIEFISNYWSLELMFDLDSITASLKSNSFIHEVHITPKNNLAAHYMLAFQDFPLWISLVLKIGKVQSGQRDDDDDDGAVRPLSCHSTSFLRSDEVSFTCLFACFPPCLQQRK